MNKEISGVDEAIVDNSAQVAAEQEDDVVTIAELLEESDDSAAVTETGAEQPQEDAPEAEQGVADQQKTVEQAQQLVKERENNAFAKRLAAERNKFERDPVYVLGRELAAQHGGDANKALEAMRERQAQELAKDPAALAKYVMEKSFAPAPAPSPAPAPAEDNGVETDKQRAQRIVDDIRNVLGDNAPVKAYIEIDPDFIQNCDLYGTAKAVLMMAQKSTAQNQAAATRERNNRLPQSIRPSGNAQPKAVDFSPDKMSSEEFRAFEEKAKKARMDGKRITFK
ncbi:MAG: hypothetical protein IKU32_02260 [Clostridia bacterium]|nr:hypothetical protein [Clostridia bacterium]